MREVLTDDGVRLRGGVGDVTRQQRAVGKHGPLPGELEGKWRRRWFLPFAARVVNGGGVEARGGARLQPAQPQADGGEGSGQVARGRLSVAARVFRHVADEGARVEEGAGGEDHRARGELPAVSQDDAGHRAVLDQHHRRFSFEQRKVRLARKPRLHQRRIAHLIHLHADGAHGRALAGIQHTGMSHRRVGDVRHDTAQRGNFAHQVGFRGATDAAIAGEMRYAVPAKSEQQRARAAAYSGERRFAPRVSAAHDNDVPGVHAPIIHG
ncbi:MAG: hypothetical protein BWY76_00988 [bacterium ADurb.Bin429]|nr:MAG: hypothetical protein BWY76_00988 [bacterium ADurb.Bin429]